MGLVQAIPPMGPMYILLGSGHGIVTRVAMTTYACTDPMAPSPHLDIELLDRCSFWLMLFGMYLQLDIFWPVWLTVTTSYVVLFPTMATIYMPYLHVHVILIWIALGIGIRLSKQFT